MNSEYVDVLFENGQFSGERKERRVVHATGEWHLSIHIWVIKGDEVLLQKRASSKESFPGLYDASVAGHVDSGESVIDAAIREAKEELSVPISDSQLIYAGCRRLIIEHPERSFISREFNHIFVYHDIGFPYVPDQWEMELILWKSLDDIRKDLAEHNTNYCIDYEEFSMVASALKSSNCVL